MRGLENVRAEFSLTALAYNLRRARNILGMEKLMAAVTVGKGLQIPFFRLISNGANNAHND